MVYATHIDLYQLTSLIPHWDTGRARQKVWMSFFSRRLPRGHDSMPVRSYLVACGIQRCLQLLSQLHFDEARIETLCAHSFLGPALKARPQLIEALKAWRFEGQVWGVEEGEFLWANPAQTQQGQVLDFTGVRPSAMPPYLQVYTDIFTAKLIETPLLSIINHMSMIATKSSHLCQAAGDRPVLELGTRRTHIEAAVDAAVAAYIGGTTGTSNLEAHHRFAVPVVGTMDHFAVQSWEHDSASIADTERAFFKAFALTYPQHASLLVDTYDMFGEETGIRNAVKAAKEAKVSLHGIRIDSQLSTDTVHKARHLLDTLGAKQTKIIVSGGVDEALIHELKTAPVDLFGVGERLVTSADSPVGVGAVGKLSWINGQVSMKRAKGSGKATLPGPIQAFRGEKGDRLCLVPYRSQQLDWHFDWQALEPKADEQALISMLWDSKEQEQAMIPSDWLLRARSKRANALASYLSKDEQAQSVFLDSELVQVIEDKISGHDK